MEGLKTVGKFEGLPPGIAQGRTVEVDEAICYSHCKQDGTGVQTDFTSS